MKKRIKIWGFLFLILVWGFFSRFLLNPNSFEVTFTVSEVLEQNWTRYPTIFIPLDTLVYTIDKDYKIYNIHNDRTIELSGYSYFSYFLPNLQYDLFVKEIKGYDAFGELVYIAPNPEEPNTLRINNYQKNKKHREQIIDFLELLNKADFEKATEILQEDKELLPFNIILEDMNLWHEKDWIYGRGILYDMSGPEEIFFKICIAKNNLYFLF